MKKSKVLMVAVMLFIAVMTMATTSVSAAPKLNRKAKTITAGKKYTIRIKGIKQKNIKKVKFTTTKKKVATVKKKSRTKAVVTAKKAGKATINVKITYKKKIKGKKVKKLKLKVTVKKANNKTSDVEKKTDNTDNTSWYDEDIEWINSYTVFDKWQDKYMMEEDATPYGFVYAPLGVSYPEWYSKADYQKIMTELNRILKEVHITEGNNINTMTDQEKAYRIGRWMTDNIDYANSDQRLDTTLFTHKTKCEGFSMLYKILCLMADVECEFVGTEGHYINGQDMNHAWNIVKLGNYWYETDMVGARNLRGEGINSLLDYFRPYGECERELYEYIHPYYNSKEFMDSHPIDTLEYKARCQLEGTIDTLYMSWEELYNLPR